MYNISMSIDNKSRTQQALAEYCQSDIKHKELRMQDKISPLFHFDLSPFSLWKTTKIQFQSICLCRSFQLELR